MASSGATRSCASNAARRSCARHESQACAASRKTCARCRPDLNAELELRASATSRRGTSSRPSTRRPGPSPHCGTSSVRPPSDGKAAMSRRLQRLNVLLREEVSELIRRELRDPRLAEFVTLTRVSTSPDLQTATVYVSVMGDEEEKENTMRALPRAAPFIRRQLIRRLSIRRTPDITFMLDESMEKAAQLLDMMKQLPPARPDE